MPSPIVPESFFSPLVTALGPAWPRPRTRLCLEGIENVQKRMAELRMRMDGVRYGGVPRKDKEKMWKAMQQEGVALERELDGLMKNLAKYPATKEQFKRPTAILSECHDAYTKEIVKDSVFGYQCVECGRECRTYVRREREDWQKEYREAMEEAERDRRVALAIAEKQSKSEQPTRMPGSYLIH